MSGILGKLAGQLASGGGNGNGTSPGGYNSQSSGSGKLVHNLTDNLTGQTHRQDLTGSSQTSYAPGGSMAHAAQKYPSEGYGRKQHMRDDWQGQGGPGGYQYPGEQHSRENDPRIGQPEHDQSASEYRRDNRSYAPGYHGGYQQSGYYQEIDGHGYKQDHRPYEPNPGRFEQGRHEREQGHGTYQQYPVSHQREFNGHDQYREGYLEDH